ncbi:hypothetical protein FQZ97_1067290 [compost metagenome]
MRSTRPTLWAKKMPDSSTPTNTPLARSCVETVTATVAIITSDELGGCSRSLRIESQLKVPMLTMIITATRAAIGISLTQGPRNTIRIRRNRPAQKVESRPRPPDFTLMTD